MELVSPGEFLGVSEEFVSGPGTFEEGGKIYAMFFGELLRDERTHRVWVKAPKVVRPLKPGDLVQGVVHKLYEAMVMVKFASVPVGGEYPANGDTAFMKISELKRGYVEKLRDCIRVGDVIRARVAQITPLATYLTMKERDLGVVQGVCSICRAENSLQSNFLVCSECGSREPRKTPLQPGEAGDEREERGERRSFDRSFGFRTGFGGG